MGEAKRRKKLDSNYGKKRNLTNRERRILEAKQHEYMMAGETEKAAAIMFELGNEMMDDNFQPIKFETKEEFVKAFVEESKQAAKANEEGERRIREWDF